MDAKTFAWIYLIENGNVNVQHSYYGGWDDLNGKDIGWQAMNQQNEMAIAKIKQVGVRWDVTYPPDSDYVSYFQGTFCDSGEKEIISGNLILNDGTVQKWIADSITVSNVFEMMAKVDEYVLKYEKIFGTMINNTN